MDRTFFLEVVTPERTFFSGECSSMVLPTLDGLHGVLAGHEPMVTAVESGVFKYRTADGMWHFAAVGKGFAEVMPEATILLVTTAERPREIDEQRAREAMARAQHRLQTLPTDHQEYIFSRAALERAKARLEAKRHQKKK